MGRLQSSVNNLINVGSKAYLGGKALQALEADKALKAKQAEEFAQSEAGKALAESDARQAEFDRQKEELTAAYPNTFFKDEDIATAYDLHSRGLLDEEGNYIDPMASHPTPGEMDAAAGDSANQNADKQKLLKKAQQRHIARNKMAAKRAPKRNRGGKR